MCIFQGELYCISSMNIGSDIFDKGHQLTAIFMDFEEGLNHRGPGLNSFIKCCCILILLSDTLLMF